MIRSVEGKFVVVAGRFSSITKAEARAALSELGARVDLKVAARTDALFAGTGAEREALSAKSAGVPVYDEAQLKALLDGSGPTMPEVFAALKKLSIALKRRPDVHVRRARHGKPVEEAALGDVAAENPDLAELYTLTDGFELEWRFRDDQGGGILEIPPAARFREADALRDDHLIQTLSEGIERGFAQSEDAAARFLDEPPLPSRIEIGTRVEFRFFAEGGRALVTGTHTPPANRETSFYGPWLLQLTTDEGTVGWTPAHFTTVHFQHDAYEHLRDPANELWANDLEASFETLARAIGPLRHYSSTPMGSLPSNARRAAGLLSARPLLDAVHAVVSLHEATAKAGLDLRARRPFEESGDEFSAQDFNGHYFHEIAGTFTGLFAGLGLRVRHACADRGVPPAELLDPFTVRRLSKIDAAAPLSHLLECETVPDRPQWWHPDRGIIEKLELPEDAVLFGGTGY